jgi:uncharacterized protein YecT (DUF1311 family)
MKLKIIVLLIGAGVLLSGCCTKPEATKSIQFPDWQPNIDQPIGQLEEVLVKLEQQQPMNYTISNVAFLYDAKLYILFHDFIDQLPEAARASEIAEQEKWLGQRKKLIGAGYAEYEGGTLASFTAGQASIDATKKRIAEIEKKMKELPTKPRSVRR